MYIIYNRLKIADCYSPKSLLMKCRKMYNAINTPNIY